MRSVTFFSRNLNSRSRSEPISRARLEILKIFASDQNLVLVWIFLIRHVKLICFFFCFWNCYFWWSRCEIRAHSHRVQFNNLLTGWSLTTYWILQPWSYFDNFDSAGGTARLDKNQIISIHFDLISLATMDIYYVTQIWVMWSIWLKLW